MLTLTKLMSTKGSKPFTSPIKVNVCGVGRTVQYTTEKGENKESTTLGIADKTASMKAILYDSSKLTVCKKGCSVMLLNYIFKSEPTPTIIVTNKTRVMVTSTLEIPATLLAEGEAIANPPPAQCIPLKQVKTSPVKSLVSVKGKVVSEELVRTVQVRGTDVQVKTVQMKEGDDAVKVSLWRDLSRRSLMGQYIQMTNVVVNSYKEEVSVSTTGRTEIEACQEPSSQYKGSLVGFESGDLTITIMMESDDNFATYEVQKELVCTALECESEDLTTLLQERLPVTCKLTLTEGQVTSFLL